MGKAIPAQHPAVVIRSHYRQLRALLAIAMIAVVGLTAAVVILANDTDEVGASSATPIGHINYGGFNPATGRPESAPLPRTQAQAPASSTRNLPVAPLADGTVLSDPPAQRYDGGPEEGSRGLAKPSAAQLYGAGAGTRYDGGPEEGSRGALASDPHSTAVTGTRYDGGPEEGSRGSDR